MFNCRRTRVSTAPCTSGKMCCPTHCRWVLRCGRSSCHQCSSIHQSSPPSYSPIATHHHYYDHHYHHHHHHTNTRQALTSCVPFTAVARAVSGHAYDSCPHPLASSPSRGIQKQRRMHAVNHPSVRGLSSALRKADIRLPEKRNSHSPTARPVFQNHLDGKVDSDQ